MNGADNWNRMDQYYYLFKAQWCKEDVQWFTGSRFLNVLIWWHNMNSPAYELAPDCLNQASPLGVYVTESSQ